MSDPTTMRYDVFQALYNHFVEGAGEDPPEVFVGMQGERIVLLVQGGDHYVLTLTPATIGAPS